VVIAIAGTSEAGQTTWVGQVVVLLGDAVAVHFDDFAAHHERIPDGEAWVEGGCAPAGWRNAPLAEHVR